jgi:hypothetical protein
MVGSCFICHSSALSALIVLNIILAVLLFSYDLRLSIQMSRYFDSIRASNVSENVILPNLSQSTSYNNPKEYNGRCDTQLNGLNPLSKSNSLGSPSKSMSISVSESTSPALSPPLFGKVRGIGLPTFMTTTNGKKMDYKFSRAGVDNEALHCEDIEVGTTSPTRTGEATQSYKTPPRSRRNGSMDTTTSNGSNSNNIKRIKRSRRNIVLDGFRVNLKLSVLKNQDNENTSNGRKFRNDLSMSMFRQLGEVLFII